MNQTPETPNDLKPLGLIAGYDIRRDGVVFRADRTSVLSVPLFRARRYAKQAIEHDPLRKSRNGVLHGRGGGEPLVFDVEGKRMVIYLSLPSKAERKSKQRGDSWSTIRGANLEASGDTDAGWYWLTARDGAQLLLHGPSWAQHLWLRGY